VGETNWSEFELIDTFFNRHEIGLPREIITGIGDDAAVIRSDKKTLLLITNDLMIEDIHYRTSWMPPFDLARKLVRINVSDIAAMGGQPTFGLLSIGLPSPLAENWLQAFSQGLSQELDAFGITLIGGDTSQSPGPVIAALTLMGKTENDTFVSRHSPHLGDTIYVTGTLGDAALGLIILESSDSEQSLSLNIQESFLTARHISPVPRLAAAGEIASKRLASCMIDISDGLIADLEHLLEKSDLGAEIDLKTVPLSAAFTNTVENYPASPESLALAGGEDYELLFTSPVSASDMIKSLADVPVTPIGTITGNPGVHVFKNGKLFPIESGGFKHQFKQKEPRHE